MMNKKYDDADIEALKALASEGLTIAKAAEKLGFPIGSTSTLAARFGISFFGKSGRPRVANPVRPYRAQQKSYYKKKDERSLDDLHKSLASRRWL